MIIIPIFFFSFFTSRIEEYFTLKAQDADKETSDTFCMNYANFFFLLKNRCVCVAWAVGWRGSWLEKCQQRGNECGLRRVCWGHALKPRTRHQHASETERPSLERWSAEPSQWKHFITGKLFTVQSLKVGCRLERWPTYWHPPNPPLLPSQFTPLPKQEVHCPAAPPPQLCTSLFIVRCLRPWPASDALPTTTTPPPRLLSPGN